MVRLSVQDGRWSTERSAGGRGAWICPTTACLEQALKRRAVGRALRTDVPPQLLTELREAVTEGSAFSPGARS